jgi:hypothetical protein
MFKEWFICSQCQHWCRDKTRNYIGVCSERLLGMDYNDTACDLFEELTNHSCLYCLDKEAFQKIVIKREGNFFSQGVTVCPIK